MWVRCEISKWQLVSEVSSGRPGLWSHSYSKRFLNEFCILCCTYRDLYLYKLIQVEYRILCKVCQAGKSQANFEKQYYGWCGFKAIKYFDRDAVLLGSWEQEPCALPISHCNNNVHEINLQTSRAFVFSTSLKNEKFNTLNSLNKTLEQLNCTRNRDEVYRVSV